MHKALHAKWRILLFTHTHTHAGGPRTCAEAGEVLLLLQALAVVRARPDPEWAQTASGVLSLGVQLGQLDRVSVCCLP